MLLSAILVAIFAPVLAPYDPYAPTHVTVFDIYQPPSAEHPLGTDDGGKDVLSSLIYGSRVSLTVGFTAAAITTIVGGLIGIIAGYLGGRVGGAADGHHRLLPGDPGHCSADRDRGHPWPVAAQHHPGHRAAGMVDHCPAGAFPDAVRARAQVRAPRQGHRRGRRPYPAAPRDAGRVAADDRQHGADHQPRRPGGVDAVVHRPRRPHGHQLGPDAELRLQPGSDLGRSVVGADSARARDRVGRARHHPARHGTRGHPQPTPEASPPGAGARRSAGSSSPTRSSYRPAR